jgi:hypothetical protein
VFGVPVRRRYVWPRQPGTYVQALVAGRNVRYRPAAKGRLARLRATGRE